MFRVKSSFLLLTQLFCAIGWLTGCAVGPDYQRPALVVPENYQAAADVQLSHWQPTQAALPDLRYAWQAFNDATLTQLLAELDTANQDIQAAAARYRQADAVLQRSRAQLFPTVGASAGIERGNSSARTGADENDSAIRNRRDVTLNASWEADLWGRVRRDNEAARANLHASAADLAAVRLSAQATLAVTYFQLRVTDAHKQLLDRTVAAYEKSLAIATNRYRAGVVSRADVAQAETQWQSAQTQARDATLQRAQFAHAIAVLLGKPPALFALPEAPEFIAMAYARADSAGLAESALPQVPVAVPSTLLQRRPDIALAEQRVIEANAQIGAARAAWFPVLTLGASGGYQSNSAADWLTLPNRVWAVGPALAGVLFDGGARAGTERAAVARYDETVADYQQVTLTGFREVEDNLLALQLLRDEAVTQDAAVRAARVSVELLTNQYQAGKVGYLDVVNVQTIAYTNARTALVILANRYSATINLIRALGGGWDTQQLAQE
ncbi:MAG: efflux transporter outer membrane subunit [Spongiibacteraceae bacterium]